MKANGNSFNRAMGLIPNSSLTRFLPEPKSRLGQTFRNVLSGLGSNLASASPGIGGLDPVYQDLINKQIEVQQQMQFVSLHSNIERSKHETQMAAVRNLRVG